MWKKSESTKAPDPYLKALRWLTVRDYSEHELRKKLKRNAFDESAIAPVIARLKEAGYLNEERMISACVRHGIAKGWGPLKIRAFLSQKGLADENVNSVEEWQTADWQALAKAVLEKKKINVLERYQKGVPLSQLKAASEDDRGISARFLLGRGFPRAVIMQVLFHEH